MSRVAKRKRVINYARVATSQHKKAVKEQLALLAEDAAKRNRVVVGKYSDVGSGTRLTHRPGFNAMVADIRATKCDIVKVTDFSRLGRDVSHLQKFVEFCDQHRVVVEDTVVGAVTKLHVSALGLVAKLQLDADTKRVKRTRGKPPSPGR